MANSLMSTLSIEIVMRNIEWKCSLVRWEGIVTVAHVFRENVWASDIKWPVVRHSREKGKDKIKGCFDRVRLLLVAVGQKGLAVVTLRQCQNKWV